MVTLKHGTESHSLQNKYRFRCDTSSIFHRITFYVGSEKTAAKKREKSMKKWEPLTPFDLIRIDELVSSTSSIKTITNHIAQMRQRWEIKCGLLEWW